MCQNDQNDIMNKMIYKMKYIIYTKYKNTCNLIIKVNVIEWIKIKIQYKALINFQCL